MSLVNLRFEDTHITHKTAGELADFLRQKHFLESIGFNKVKYDGPSGPSDFKKVIDAIRTNKKISKILFQNMTFDEEAYGKTLGNTIIENR